MQFGTSDTRYSRALMAWIRSYGIAALGLLIGGCGDDAAQDTANASTGDAQTDGPAPTTAVTTDDTVDDSGGCIEGNAGCACLEGTCVGGLFCIEDQCVIGPQVEIDEDRSVLAGLVVPIDAEVMAESFSWSQVSGPTAEILGAMGQEIEVVVPADAAVGEVITLRLTAERNGVSLDTDVNITIIDAVFENFLGGIADPAQLGSTEGLAFGPTGMWVASSEGFVSRFDSKGAFVERYETPGDPVGANFLEEALIVANRGAVAVQQLNSVSGELSVLFDTFDGQPVGTVNYPLPDNNGNVYVSTRLDQRVLRWDAKLGAATVFLQDAQVINPNAMAFGPEGNAIYIGTVGHVWRVPLIDGGMAGTPEDYLDLGDDTGPLEVDGLTFDEGNNLWVGCPVASTLFVAPYSGKGPTAVARSWVDPAPGFDGFVNVRFGDDDFDDQTLYWTNLGDSSVGRMHVGLQEINAPLAD